MKFDGFDWDTGNRDKCRKHGVSLEEIEEVLCSDPLVIQDRRNSVVEDRYHAVGRSRAGRSLFVVFTFRLRDGATFVRPISARYMHASEIALYEKAKEISGPEE